MHQRNVGVLCIKEQASVIFHLVSLATGRKITIQQLRLDQTNIFHEDNCSFPAVLT